MERTEMKESIDMFAYTTNFYFGTLLQRNFLKHLHATYRQMDRIMDDPKRVPTTK